MKKRIAVFFGGRSPEHDVSIVTGLQALEALDQQAFEGFPVYIATDGRWFTGDALRTRANYIPREAVHKTLESVSLDLNPTPEGRGRLVTSRRGMFSSPRSIDFDVALLALHGLSGEDGRVQSLFEIANVPYTGVRHLSAAMMMDKAITKRMLAGTSVRTLPHALLQRPEAGLVPGVEQVRSAMQDVSFPVVVKPVHLGSSIGVARAENVDEVRAVLPAIFKLDTAAMLEPFVEHLVEYNVAVRTESGRVLTSAIEEPKSNAELLDFKSKYMSGGKLAGGSKLSSGQSEGMLSLTRTINPEIPEDVHRKIRTWAEECFVAGQCNGAPRIDFLCNRQTGDVYLNEVNPCPGSFGYFLWEKASAPMMFTELLSFLLEEATSLHRRSQLPDDPTPADARLFSRG